MTQRNFRVHLAISVMVVALGMWLGLTLEDWALLALTIGAVLVTEVFNTAAERLVDLVSPDYHPLAKQVKDLAAGAVLVAAIISVIVGLLILGPPLWQALRGS
jgi:diacylglycerol kinase